jgi:hypothetical protein
MHPHLPQIDSIREMSIVESVNMASIAATSMSVPNGSSLPGAIVAAGDTDVTIGAIVATGDTDVTTGATGALVDGSAFLFPMHPRVDAAKRRTIRIYTIFMY